MPLHDRSGCVYCEGYLGHREGGGQLLRAGVLAQTGIRDGQPADAERSARDLSSKAAEDDHEEGLSGGAVRSAISLLAP